VSKPTGRTDDERRPALPSDHVFVVQFRARSRAHRLAAAGRVQHLRSGEAVHFDSPEELLAFTRRVLRAHSRLSSQHHSPGAAAEANDELRDRSSDGSGSASDNVGCTIVVP
jgi:hypothetical protein